MRRVQRNDDRKILGAIELPMGVDEFFDESGNIRPSAGCFVGDSGAIGNCGSGRRPAARGLRAMLQHPADN
eukprot:5168882-Heterocapsa_arctica.AAC.1